MKPDKKAAEMSVTELARYIDHSVLKPEFTEADIRELIRDGVRYKCRTVCVNPSSAEIAKELCAGTETGVCVVCDFPFGLSTTKSKVQQAKCIISDGFVPELDVVSNYGWIRSGQFEKVTEDIKAVADVCHEYNVQLKVIFETDALTMSEVRKATECAIAAGADFAKTSTGFYTGGPSQGATVQVIREMLDVAAGRIKIKGSGSIRTREHFLELIDLGIDRMGIGYKSTPVVLGLE
ncbi:MAG: deoxyribose-phosphate aldolase [Bifidobacteriaceae bacterium]|jgi:deoxyribose-phosphate aldolase|nr:deoxyribose-phosphate aldolase [Bifidobacteriaceae bacterium]